MGPRLARILQIISTALLLATAAFAAPVVTITAPASSATVGAPVQITAAATDSSPVTLMQVYVDGVKKYEVKGASVSTTFSLGSGSHKLTVQSYDASGVGKSSVSFSATASIPPLATYSDIDQMTNWASCDKCAGPGGNGPTTPHTITQNVSSPAMDSKSAEFWVGGTTKYAAALWWKQLGANPAASKFTYDLYFYLKNPSAAQALEFDVNQTLNGKQYVMGTQCNIKGSHQWDVWDYNLHWLPTGIPCNAPTAYTWHHLTWEFERTSGGQVHTIAVTYDGKKSYVDKYLAPRPKTTAELNVAIQLDGNSSMTNYSEWADKIKLTVW